MIINSGFDSFFQKTKSALEEFQGSPIKKNGKVMKFLTQQFGVRNEHVIRTQFESQEKEIDQRQKVFVIQKIDMEPNVTSDTLEYAGSHISLASSEDEYKQTCKDLVHSAIPDHDGIKDNILNLHKVEERLKEDTHVYDMDTFELIDWVVEEFDTDYLISEDFIGELTHNWVKFEVEIQYIKIT